MRPALGSKALTLGAMLALGANRRVMGSHALLPTSLPTATTSIDYSSQGLRGTIPTQVRAHVCESVGRLISCPPLSAAAHSLLRLFHFCPHHSLSNAFRT